MSGEASSVRERGSHVGWWAAGVVLIAIFAASAVVWLMFHP